MNHDLVIMDSIYGLFIINGLFTSIAQYQIAWISSKQHGGLYHGLLNQQLRDIKVLGKCKNKRAKYWE